MYRNCQIACNYSAAFTSCGLEKKTEINLPKEGNSFPFMSATHSNFCALSAITLRHNFVREIIKYSSAVRKHCQMGVQIIARHFLLIETFTAL